MCGIAGIVSITDLAPGTREDVARMNAAQAHRGPDADRVWAETHAALGHRRLSIIDLSERGSQPMPSDNGELMLVCNGEIYNHRELKTGLAKDYPYRSATDIETILPLYKRHGKDCCQHMVGMFAFAIWDKRQRELFLCRDRLGEKPLFYALSGGTFAFASEIKALLELHWVDRSFDEEILPNLFSYGMTPAPLTPFKGIRALPPASRLLWREGKVTIERYWKIDFGAVRSRSWEEALEEYEHLIRQSVAGCLVADVPLGIMLSGGVDSSTVAWAVGSHGQSMQTFCVTAQGKENEGEGRLSSIVAQRLGAHHRVISFGDQQDIRNLPKVIADYDQPFNSSTSWYADALAQRMKQHVSVVLSGSGADELFAGYAGYNDLLALSPTQRLLRSLPVWARTALRPFVSGKVSRSLEASLATPTDWYAQGLDRSAQNLMQTFLAPGPLSRWTDYEVSQHVRPYLEESSPTTLLQAARYADLMVRHHHGHCTLNDISGMSYALEYRNPFLDHRLVEFAFSLEQPMLIGDPVDPTHNKLITKRFLERHLPQDLVYTPKRGFGYDIDYMRLFSTVYREGIQRQVLEGNLPRLNLFAPESLHRAITHSLGTAWMMLSFSIWADLHLFGETVGQIGARLACDQEFCSQ